MALVKALLEKLRALLLWGLFFLICFGLGYPTLNRYDPRLGGTCDSVDYHQLVVGKPQEVARFTRCRILTPFLAKPIYWMAKGRTRTWNPVFFGLLVINAAFCATTAYLIYWVGSQIVGNGAISLLGAFVYLLNFTVSNGQLGGLVDAGEACGMMVVTWALFTNRWGWLLLVSPLGALAKETFVPFSLVFVATWWLVTAREGGRFSRLAYWVGMAILQAGTLSILWSVVEGSVVWPWQAIPKIPAVPLWTGFIGCFSSPSFWYPFVWLLPLGVLRLRMLPRPWVLASGVTALVACGWGSHYGIEGNLGRVLFNVVGPILSLSTALWLTHPQR